MDSAKTKSEGLGGYIYHWGVEIRESDIVTLMNDDHDGDADDYDEDEDDEDEMTTMKVIEQ